MCHTVTISGVSSPELSPLARSSGANFTMPEPAQSPNFEKIEGSSPLDTRTRYPKPARDTRSFFRLQYNITFISLKLLT